MSDETPDDCAVCGEPVTDGMPWIVLNRWVLGTGRVRAMVEGLNEDDEYLWEMWPDGLAEDERATGKLLHWPICASQWIDGKMIEASMEIRS